MGINAPYLTERAVMGMFFERLMQDIGTNWIDKICTVALESNQDSEDYAWMGMVPQLTVKAGEKKFDQMRKTKWTVDNVVYQGGIAIPKNHILYDKTSQVQIRVNELVDRAQAHWAGLIAPLIISGPSAVCYDGQFFFDTDHAEGDSGTQDNDISADISAYPVTNHGTVTQPSAGEMIFAIMDAVTQILGFKDDKGEYVNEEMTSFHVMVPHTLLTAGLQAMQKTRIDGGSSNLLIEQDSFTFTVQASPRLSSWTDKFAVFATQGQQKPFIRQQRIPDNAAPGYDVNGMLYESLWLESEHCIKNSECLVSIETERAAAYGDWKKACLVTMV